MTAALYDPRWKSHPTSGYGSEHRGAFQPRSWHGRTPAEGSSASPPHSDSYYGSDLCAAKKGAPPSRSATTTSEGWAAEEEDSSMEQTESEGWSALAHRRFRIIGLDRTAGDEGRQTRCGRRNRELLEADNFLVDTEKEPSGPADAVGATHPHRRRLSSHSATPSATPTTTSTSTATVPRSKASCSATSQDTPTGSEGVHQHLLLNDGLSKVTVKARRVYVDVGLGEGHHPQPHWTAASTPPPVEASDPSPQGTRDDKPADTSLCRLEKRLERIEGLLEEQRTTSTPAAGSTDVDAQLRQEQAGMQKELERLRGSLSEGKMGRRTERQLRDLMERVARVENQQQARLALSNKQAFVEAELSVLNSIREHMFKTAVHSSQPPLRPPNASDPASHSPPPGPPPPAPQPHPYPHTQPQPPYVPDRREAADDGEEAVSLLTTPAKPPRAHTPLPPHCQQWLSDREDGYEGTFGTPTPATYKRTSPAPPCAKVASSGTQTQTSTDFAEWEAGILQQLQERYQRHEESSKLDEAFTESQAEVVRLARVVDGLRREVDLLRRALDEEREAHQATHDKLAGVAHEHNIASLKNSGTIQHLERECERLANDLRRAEERCTATEQGTADSFARLQLRGEEQHARLVEKEAKVRDLERELEETVGGLRKELKSKGEELLAAEQRMKALESRVDEAIRTHLDTEEALAEEQRKRAALEATVEELSARGARKTGQDTRAVQTDPDPLPKLRDEVIELRERVQTLQESSAALENARRDLLRQLEKQREEAEREGTRLRGTTRQLEDRLGGAEEALRHAAQSNHQTQMELAAANERCEEMRRQLHNAEEKWRKEVESSDRQFSEACTLQRELSRLKEESSMLHSRMLAAETAVQERDVLKREVESLRADAISTASTLSSLRKQLGETSHKAQDIESLKCQVEFLQAEANAAASAQAQLRAAKEAADQRAHEAFSHAEAEGRTASLLRTELEQERARTTELLRATCDGRQTSCSKCTSLLEALNSRAKELEMTRQVLKLGDISAVLSPTRSSGATGETGRPTPPPPENPAPPPDPPQQPPPPPPPQPPQPDPPPRTTPRKKRSARRSASAPYPFPGPMWPPWGAWPGYPWPGQPPPPPSSSPAGSLPVQPMSEPEPPRSSSHPRRFSISTAIRPRSVSGGEVTTSSGRSSTPPNRKRSAHTLHRYVYVNNP